MVDDAALTDQRRFSAVLLVHPRLQRVEQVAALLPDRIPPTGTVPVPVPVPGWDLDRARYLTSRSYYPNSTATPEDVAEAGLFAHDFYVAGRPAGDGFPATLLVASPYVRLLHQMVRQLARVTPGPALQYLAVDMQATVRLLQSAQSALAVTRVTVQMFNQPGLQLVSLTGSNPLDSELHAAIAGVTHPYGVRIEVASGQGAKSRVNVDRHGNVFWYQTHEDRVSAPLKVIDALAAARVLRATRLLPLERKSDEDAS